MLKVYTFLKNSFSGIVQPHVMGQALHRAWISIFYLAAHFLVPSDSGSSAVNLLYNSSVLFLILILLAGGIFPKRMSTLLYLRRVRITAPLLMAAGTLILLLGGNMGAALGSAAPGAGGTIGVGIALASGMMTGIGSGFMLLLWGESFGSLDETTAQIHSALAFTLAIVLYVLFIVLFSFVLYLLMGTVLALLSGVALSRVPNPRSGQDMNPAPEEGRGILRIAFASLIVSLLFEAVPALSEPGDQGFNVMHSASILSLLGSAFIIAFIIFITVFVSKKSDMGFIYRFVPLFLIAGILLSLIPRDLGATSPIILSAGYGCFELIFWIALSNLSYRYHYSPTRVFGLGRAGWALGVLLGGLCARIPLLMPDFTFFGTSHILLVTASVLLALISCTLILPERTIVTITTGYRGKRSTLQSRYHKLAGHYGLTQRETEVLAYLVKGRDSLYIQNALNISAGTVSTHRQRIYQKTGVHSRQELLDLMEGL